MQKNGFIMFKLICKVDYWTSISKKIQQNKNKFLGELCGVFLIIGNCSMSMILWNEFLIFRPKVYKILKFE
jgi:hypothetical protein